MSKTSLGQSERVEGRESKTFNIPVTLKDPDSCEGCYCLREGNRGWNEDTNHWCSYLNIHDIEGHPTERPRECKEKFDKY